MQVQWRNMRRAQMLLKKPGLTLLAAFGFLFGASAIANSSGESSVAGSVLSQTQPPTNPLWHEEKVKNFLPHMTSPEVRDLLTRTDMALIPVPSLEQHGLHAPIGTDYYLGVEEAKLIAQRTDVLVAPVLLIGQSPYHMDFPGTITL